MKKFKIDFKKRTNRLKALLFCVTMFMIVGSIASVKEVSFEKSFIAGTGIVMATAPLALTDQEKLLVEHMKGEMIKKFDELVTSNVAVKEMREMIEKFNGAKTEADLLKLKEGMTELGLKLQSISEKSRKDGEPVKKSFADHIMNGVKDLWSHPENIANLKKNNAKTVLQVKLAYGEKIDNPMTEGTSVVAIGTNSVPFSLTEFEPGLTRVARRQPFIAQLVNVSRTIMEFIAWAEQTNIDPGVAGNTAEGAAKTVGSFRITEKSQMIETMTYYIKISKRMLDDLAFIENEIRTELMTVLALRLDAQTLNGNGTSPQMKGILQYAQTFSATSSLAGSITSVSNYDALVAAILQIRADGTNLNGEIIDIFEPNYIVLHPADAAIMGLTKDSLGRYLMPPFMSPDGKKIEGLPIIENVGMTKGSYLVGDFTKSNLRIREDANITFGYENDDFTKNLVTILGEQRAGHYIKANHVKAFVADTFAATKAIIGTV